MIYGMDEPMEVRHSQESACAGTYTLMVPEDRKESAPLRLARLEGVALGKGLYRVRIERVGDA